MAAGHKTGGRKKGVPNKAKAEIESRLKALGCDPIEGMARIAQMAEEDAQAAEKLSERIAAINLAGKMYAELAEYVAPKRSRIEHVGDADQPVAHKIELVVVDPKT